MSRFSPPASRKRTPSLARHAIKGLRDKPLGRRVKAGHQVATSRSLLAINWAQLYIFVPGSPLIRYFVPCRSNESKAYPLILGDDIFDIYCNMATTETDACGIGGWALAMKIDGKKVYVVPTLPIITVHNNNAI